MARGDLLINIDDDDYYPPDKVMYTVQEMQKNPDYMISGSSFVYMYYKKKIYSIGPYGNNHATAGTFAYYKNYYYSYQPVSKGEERQFLDNYKVPILQLDTKKVILIMRHESNTANTFSIERLKNVSETTLQLEDFILDSKVRAMFI